MASSTLDQLSNAREGSLPWTGENTLSGFGSCTVLAFGDRGISDERVSSTATRLGWSIERAPRGHDACAARLATAPIVCLVDVDPSAPFSDRDLVILRGWASRAPMLGLWWGPAPLTWHSVLSTFDDIVHEDALRTDLRLRMILAVGRRMWFTRRPDVPGLHLHTTRQSVEADGLRVRLTGREFQLLALLSRNVGIPMTREAIFRAVWGIHPAPAASNVVDVYIGYLRQKLHAIKRDHLLRTVRGIGYMIDTSIESQEFPATKRIADGRGAVATEVARAR